MKICQVNPGILPIPRTNYGAIELIIWNYKIFLERLGHQVDIRFPNEIKQGDYDIVHSHVANQSLMLANRNINYIHHLHDHHVQVFGKGSFCFNQNLEAFQKSRLGIVPSEDLVNFLENPYKIFYFPHGVDSDFFKPIPQKSKDIQLLCIANNGFIHDVTYDRKGFRRAIQLASSLNLPITIAGPSNNNKLFFEKNQDLLSYKKLTVLYDLNDDQILKLYQTHHIFLHFSVMEAGHPNLTLLEALSCGLPVVGSYLGTDFLGGMNLSFDADSDKKVTTNIINDLDNNSILSRKTGLAFDYSFVVKNLIKIYSAVANNSPITDTNTFKQQIVSSYANKVNKTSCLRCEPKDQFNFTFILGAKCEIVGKSQKDYLIEFYDKTKGEYVFSSTIRPGCWTKSSPNFFVNYDIKVSCNNHVLFKYTPNFNDKRVFISLESKALGDTIAWIPYVEEFRIKHKCKIICSTFWNDVFKGIYTNIEFAEPGDIIDNLYGMFSIGWFENKNGFQNPIDPRTAPLQKVATDILGLEYHEEKPVVFIQNTERKMKDKYICISTKASARAKHWNYNNGWQILVDLLNALNFKVVVIQTESSELENVIKPDCSDIHETISWLNHCEFFIGLSSGVSWLAWALNRPAVMISGFTKPWNEFSCIRIHNDKVCNGCMNSERYEFDKGDWDWCPVHKGSDRQFECSKTITPEQVMLTLKENNLIE